ncbi:MAG: TM2 domain-containing protein [Lachnospiraceae bacterium]|nr:TM2 domain-containing protein [Lachnospiraceae bacterium]
MTYNNVTGRQEPYLAGHDKTAMALFSIFLGGFGVHNFIMGETRKGVIRIVFTLAVCGVGGIFGLVDFIKILSDTYVVDPEKYFF